MSIGNSVAAALAQDDGSSGSWAPRRALLGHKDRCFDCAFGPHLGPGGQLAATASEDCTARLWSITGTETTNVQVLTHAQEVLRVAWAPPSVLDGRLFATGSADGGARIWAFSASELDPTASSAGESSTNDSSSDSSDSSSSSSSSSSSIRARQILRTESGHFPIVLDHGAENQVYSVVFSAGFGHAAGGNRTLVTAADDAVQCWDLTRVLQEKPCTNPTGGSHGASADALPTSRTYHSGESSEVSGVVASSWRFAAEAGAPVYGGNQRNTNQAAYIFDLALSSQPVTMLGRGSSGSNSSSNSGSGGGFAGTNSLLAAALSDGTCRISSFGVATSLAPSSSGSSSSSGGNGRPTKSTAVARAGEVAALSTGGEFGHLTSVAWAPDGLTLATCCGNGTTLLWDARTWKCRKELSGAHQRAAFGCLFLPSNDAPNTTGAGTNADADANTGDVFCQSVERARELTALTWSSDGSAALWNVGSDNVDSSNKEEEDEGGDDEDSGTPVSAPQSVVKVNNGSAAEPFPLFRCAVSDDGKRLLAAGGSGGTKSFLGTPVWLYDLVPTPSLENRGR